MENLGGITKLSELLKNMEPRLNEGEFVFATVKDVKDIPREIPLAEMKEPEGTTIVLLKKDAEDLGLSFDFVASWITLNIHSSLEAVGLTAAFSTALAKQDISCNVIAGYYHDHIFVETHDQLKAMQILKEMSENYK